MELGGKEIGMIAGVIIVALVLFGGIFYIGSMETSSTSSTSSAESEVPTMLRSIAAAEIAYADAFGDGYISASAAPRKPHEVNGDALPWDLKFSKGFRRLSWSPPDEAQLQGSYEVNADAKGFVVRGFADTDGDGKPATYELTCTHPPSEAEKCKDIAPKQLSEDGVL